MNKISCTIINNLLRHVIASVFIVTATFAADAPKPSSSNSWETASVEELTEIISQTAAQISEDARKASEMKQTVESAWNNPRFTSETIETKRQALKKAEAAFIQARIDLQKEMNRLPEIKQLTEDNEALLNKIETLSKNKTRLIKLLRDRRKTLPPNE